MTDEQINEAKNTIKNFITENSHFWMLLNNEKRYYTIFWLSDHRNISLDPRIEDEVIECLKELGTIKSIEQVDDAIEAWIIDKNDSEAYAYYLFNYDKGVVVCR